jgi:hypothetical protein
VTVGALVDVVTVIVCPCANGARDSISSGASAARMRLNGEGMLGVFINEWETGEWKVAGWKIAR